MGKNWEAWRAAVHGVAKSWTQLRDWTSFLMCSAWAAMYTLLLVLICIENTVLRFYPGTFRYCEKFSTLLCFSFVLFVYLVTDAISLLTNTINEKLVTSVTSAASQDTQLTEALGSGQTATDAFVGQGHSVALSSHHSCNSLSMSIQYYHCKLWLLKTVKNFWHNQWAFSPHSPLFLGVLYLHCQGIWLLTTCTLLHLTFI